MEKNIQLNERELAQIIDSMKSLNKDYLEPLIQKLENY
jgi:hypothetical protein